MSSLNYHSVTLTPSPGNHTDIKLTYGNLCIFREIIRLSRRRQSYCVGAAASHFVSSKST